MVGMNREFELDVDNSVIMMPTKINYAMHYCKVGQLLFRERRRLL
jgi:hypothetical protein